MDARLDTHKLLGLAEGDDHVIRNAGGVVSDDVIRSLVISQRLLGTREIMLIHHTDCGMLGFRDDDVKDAIQEETGLRPAFSFEAFRDLDQDVRQSISPNPSQPLHSPLKDQVRGFVYDCATGQSQTRSDRTRMMRPSTRANVRLRWSGAATLVALAFTLALACSSACIASDTPTPTERPCLQVPRRRP